MSKHSYSPGPWRLGADGAIETAEAVVLVDAFQGWARLSKADARLIASAPEMLELLLEWLASDESLRINEGVSYGPIEETRALLKRIEEP